MAKIADFSHYVYALCTIGILELVHMHTKPSNSNGKSLYIRYRYVQSLHTTAVSPDFCFENFKRHFKAEARKKGHNC